MLVLHVLASVVTHTLAVLPIPLMMLHKINSILSILF